MEMIEEIRSGEQGQKIKEHLNSMERSMIELRNEGYTEKIKALFDKMETELRSFILARQQSEQTAAAREKTDSVNIALIQGEMAKMEERFKRMIEEIPKLQNERSIKDGIEKSRIDPRGLVEAIGSSEDRSRRRNQAEAQEGLPIHDFTGADQNNKISGPTARMDRSNNRPWFAPTTRPNANNSSRRGQPGSDSVASGASSVLPHPPYPDSWQMGPDNNTMIARPARSQQNAARTLHPSESSSSSSSGEGLPSRQPKPQHGSNGVLGESVSMLGNVKSIDVGAMSLEELQEELRHLKSYYEYVKNNPAELKKLQERWSEVSIAISKKQNQIQPQYPDRNSRSHSASAQQHADQDAVRIQKKIGELEDLVTTESIADRDTTKIEQEIQKLHAQLQKLRETRGRQDGNAGAQSHESNQASSGPSSAGALPTKGRKQGDAGNGSSSVQGGLQKSEDEYREKSIEELRKMVLELYDEQKKVHAKMGNTKNEQTISELQGIDKKLNAKIQEIEETIIKREGVMEQIQRQQARGDVDAIVVEGESPHNSVQSNGKSNSLEEMTDKQLATYRTYLMDSLNHTNNHEERQKNYKRIAAVGNEILRREPSVPQRQEGEFRRKVANTAMSNGRTNRNDIEDGAVRGSHGLPPLIKPSNTNPGHAPSLADHKKKNSNNDSSASGNRLARIVDEIAKERQTRELENQSSENNQGMQTPSMQPKDTTRHVLFGNEEKGSGVSFRTEDTNTYTPGSRHFTTVARTIANKIATFQKTRKTEEPEGDTQQGNPVRHGGSKPGPQGEPTAKTTHHDVDILGTNAANVDILGTNTARKVLDMGKKENIAIPHVNPTDDGAQNIKKRQEAWTSSERVATVKQSESPKPISGFQTSPPPKPITNNVEPWAHKNPNPPIAQEKKAQDDFYLHKENRSIDFPKSNLGTHILLTRTVQGIPAATYMRYHQCRVRSGGD